MPPKIPLLYKVAFGYPRSFVFPFKFDYYPFKFSEELCWDFNGKCIEYVDCFWQDCHFCYLYPSYPRAWTTFPFFGIFFNLLLEGHIILTIYVFYLCGKHYSKILFVFLAIIKGHVSLISFSALLLSYLIGLQIFEFILYPVVL